MARSMTGYGRAEMLVDERKIIVEIRTVNHRYFEFSARVPRSMGFLEEKLKSFISTQLSRGKTDVYVSIDTQASDVCVAVNHKAARSYLEAFKELSEQTGLKNDISLIALARLPEVFTLEKPTEDADAVWAAVSAVARMALEDLVAMRKREGDNLCLDISSKLDRLEALRLEILQHMPQIVKDYRNRLLEKISLLLSDCAVDESRLMTEVAIFADNVCIDEETVRLASHIEQYRELLSSDESVGRKMDFLSQELNREINTIGSKSQDVRISKTVIEMKSIVEKIREQTQNIE